MTPAETPRKLRLRQQNRAQARPVLYVPGPEDLVDMARALDLLGLRKVRLQGSLSPENRDDWRLDARLGATAIQPCSVTLEPVTTRIETQVLRVYSAGYTDPGELEAEMPQDDSLEPLPDILDLHDLVQEALALALPDFPRAPGADLGEIVAAPPGAAPLEDVTPDNPFRVLAGLKDKPGTDEP